MNQNDIKRILEELYAVDSSLRSRERELIRMITALAVKPPVKRNPEFFNQLRTRLLVELSRTKNNKMTIAMILSKNMRYVVAGLAVLVVAVGVFQFAGPKKQTGNSLLSVNITKVGDHAFGTLNTLSAAEGSKQSLDSGTAPTQPGQNTAASNSVAPQPTSMGMAAGGLGGGSSAGAGVSSRVMAPDSIMYPSTIAYVYKGDTFTQDQAKLDVLKKITGSFSAGDLSSVLGPSGLGLVDTNSFPGSQVTNLTFTQNQSFGYTTNVDFTTGEIYISMNWSQWPQNNNYTPLSASDIPATSTVIGIANQFIADHNIPTGNYGTPEVINIYYGYGPVPLASDSVKGAMMPYFSDSMQVLYPLMVNGKKVYTPDGTKIGLSVEVNFRYKKVSNVYGLNIQSYQASSYDAITDAQKIISLAESPTFYPIMYMSASGGGVSVGSSGSGVSGSGSVSGGSTPGSGTSVKNAQEITLGTPFEVYVQMYQYDNKTGMGTQFLVPGFAFPITSEINASGYYPGRNVVIVPLVQEFLQDNNPVQIMKESVPPSTPAMPAPAVAPKK